MSYESDFARPRIIDKESLAELANIYKNHYNEDSFPTNFCTRISHEVTILGFKMVDGYFDVDSPMEEYGNFFRVGHSWCVDGKGKIIDLTLSQFNKGLEKPVRKGILIISPENPLHARYEDRTDEFRSPL